MLEAPSYPLGAYPDLEPFFESLRRDMQLRRAIQRVPYASSITPDANKGEIVIVDVLTGDLTVANPVNARDSMRLYFSFTQDATGGRTVTFGSDFMTSWGTIEAANTTSTVDFWYDGSVGKWIQGSDMISTPSGGGLPSVITQLITFDRDPNPPFAVTATSGVVTSLDSDLLDGQHGTFYRDAGNLNAGTLLNARVAEANVTQHEAAIDHDALLNFVVGEHFLQSAITVVGTIATGVWNGTAIANAFVADLPTSKITSGTFADARISGASVVQHEGSINHNALANYLTSQHFTQGAITTVGTITSGVWSASVIATTYTAAKVVSVSGGTGVDSSGGENPSLTFDAAELGLGATLIASDHLVAANGGVSNRQVISSIPLSIFNNDVGWTTNTGDITRVNIAAGDGLSGDADTTSGDHTQTIDVDSTVIRTTGTQTLGGAKQFTSDILVNKADASINLLAGTGNPQVFFKSGAGDRYKLISTGVNSLTFADNNGIAKAVIDSTNFTPAIDVGIALGTSSFKWSRLYTNSVIAGAPTGGDKGAGTINVATNVFKNNSAYTNPDAVLEKFYTGKVVKFASSPFADYPGLMPLAELREYTREHWHLPRIHRDAMGVFDQTDVLLEKVEELVLYVCGLNEEMVGLKAQLRALEVL